MNLLEADKIVQIWGRYLEYAQGKLGFIFGAHIPRSFLPFSIEILEEAMNVVAKHHHSMGNYDAAKTVQGGIGVLAMYDDDEEAIIQAAKRFNDPKWREAILPAFKAFQEKWIELQRD
jgi:hypothetical protein